MPLESLRLPTSLVFLKQRDKQLLRNRTGMHRLLEREKESLPRTALLPRLPTKSLKTMLNSVQFTLETLLSNCWREKPRDKWQWPTEAPTKDRSSAESKRRERKTRPTQATCPTCTRTLLSDSHICFLHNYK